MSTVPATADGACTRLNMPAFPRAHAGQAYKDLVDTDERLELVGVYRAIAVLRHEAHHQGTTRDKSSSLLQALLSVGPLAAAPSGGFGLKI